MLRDVSVAASRMLGMCASKFEEHADSTDVQFYHSQFAPIRSGGYGQRAGVKRISRRTVERWASGTFYLRVEIAITPTSVCSLARLQGTLAPIDGNTTGSPHAPETETLLAHYVLTGTGTLLRAAPRAADGAAAGTLVRWARMRKARCQTDG